MNKCKRQVFDFLKRRRRMRTTPGPGPPYSSLWATSELEPLADEGKLEVVESDQSWLRSSSWGSQRLDPSSLSVAGRSQPRRWRLTQPPVSRSRSPNARWPPPDQPGLFWPVISELRRQAASAQGLVMTAETAKLGSPLSRPQEPRPRGTVAVQLFAESLLAATAPKPRGASMLSSDERAAFPWRSLSRTPPSRRHRHPHPELVPGLSG